MRRDAWQALADPTRRKIIEVLAEKPLSVNEIVDHFDISRPAISKQLKILQESSLIDIHSSGRERKCSLSLAPLQEVQEWVNRYEQFWLTKLDRLGDYLDEKGE